MPKPPKELIIDYTFTFENGKTKKFSIRLDPVNLNLITEKKEAYPDWTRLSHNQCPNCPLNEAEHPRCPVAVNLTDVMDAFKDGISFEEVDVEIKTEARTFVKHTALQYGVYSIIGIYMVASGCPVMDKLRPMVKTHLPFATLDETIIRAVSTYLMAQFFLYKKGKKPDWDLKKLVDVYEQIHIVNTSFFKRIKDIQIEDANLNAVVHLDCFTHFANMSLEETELKELEGPFAAYLNDPAL